MFAKIKRFWFYLSNLFGNDDICQTIALFKCITTNLLNFFRDSVDGIFFLVWVFDQFFLILTEKNTISFKTAQKCAKILNENVFNILGTDALKVLPQTEEEKEILIELIKNL